MNMSIVRKNVVPAIIALAIMVGFAFAFATSAKATTLRVVQTPTLHLYSGETIAATTMRITPYPKDLDGTKLTIADFGTLPTVTVDPKLSGIEEIESFTSITDNGDNTATLSGLTRNLTSKYPYTTAGTGRSHGAGATVVFGNNPQIYGRLWAPENQATSTDILYFTSTFMPRFDVDPGSAAYTAAPSTVFVDMAQLTRTAIAGATNATRAVQGLVQIAFRGQAASSTPLGTTGAFAVLTSDIATSSPSLAMSTSSVVMTRLDSRIDPIFMSTSSTYTMNILSNASSTFMGTTTLAANIATGKGLVLNGVAYTAPSIQGVAGSRLTNDGLGNQSWQIGSVRYVTGGVSGATLNSPNGGFATSSVMISFPANTMTSSSTVDIYGNALCNANGSGTEVCNYFLKTLAGLTVASFSLSPGASTRFEAQYHIIMSATSTTASQQSYITAPVMTTAGTVAALSPIDSFAFSGLNFSSAQTLVMVMQVVTAANNAGPSGLGGVQYIVNP